MPYKLNSQEVLLYLNSLGYTNISAELLKEFMHDLKKLIKYEEKRRKDESGNTSVRESVDDIFENLYRLSTLESRAKQVPVKDQTPPVKEKAASVRIVPKLREYGHCACHEQKIKGSSPKAKTDKPKILMDKDTQTEINLNPSVSSKSVSTKKKKRKTSVKSSTQLIKTTSCHCGKSDPVALFHQYEKEWKRVKIPGEDSRTDLRWSIRQKMNSGPRCCNPK